MPVLSILHSCSLCSSPSSVKNFDEHCVAASNDIEVSPPTRAEYAGQAAREFLNILNDVAQEVPIPGFSTAVKIAVKIMKTCDDSQANLESVEELKYRIQDLFKVMVDKLEGKKPEEIHPELISEIDTLQMDLAYVEKTLDKVTSQPRILFVMFMSLNDGKVNKCVTRVNNAMERFNFACNIGNTNMLTRVNQQLDITQLTIDGVKELLDKLVTESPSSRAPIPANSAIFHGRDSLVAELVGIITGSSMAKDSMRHICLLGPGGMGKTSTSLAVMGHLDVKAKYENHLRVWIPCVKASSISLLFDTLRSSLAISKETGDIRGAIIKALQASPPIVMLLDNFETPWDADGAQMEVAQLLRDIHAIPQVTLFITMRSSAPPCDDLPWHHVDLRGVDTAAAQEIFTAKHPEGRDDPDLPRLLALIDHMPLAVTLMAKVAKMTHLSAAELVDEYDKLGTSMLGQGSDAVSSIDVCISLSVYSSRMKAHPEAFNLLCTLSMLPTGTSYKMLSKWWARNLPNLPGALDVLKSTSLVEERGSTYFVLPVIQRYILDPTHFNLEVRMSMIESACAFLEQHKSKIGDPFYKEHIAAVSPEEGNLEAVLLQVTTPDPHVIRNGLLLLARYQTYNKPRFDIVEHALKLVQALDDNLLRGDILHCYGNISKTCLQYDKALQQLKEALNLFLSLPDRKKAAESRLSMNCVLAGNFDLQQQSIREALADFKSADDEGGVGRCLLYLGVSYIHSRNYLASLTFLKEAEGILAKIKDQYHHTECTRHLAWIYYWTCQYEIAHSWAALSLEECKSTGISLGCQWVLETLGQIASAQSDYKGSLEHFFDSLTVHKSMGLSPSGRALEGLGLAWLKLRKTMEARMAFKEALQQYSSQDSVRDSQIGILRTQFFLKYLENPDLSPSTQELSALYTLYTQDHLNSLRISAL